MKIINFLKNHQEIVCLAIAMMIAIPMAVVGTLSLPDKSAFNLVFCPFFIIFAVGGMLWLMLLLSLPKNRSKEGMKNDVFVPLAKYKIFKHKKQQ